MEELDNEPDKKFSISLSKEYVEILDDIVKRDNRTWQMKMSRNRIIQKALKEYINRRGYIVTKELLGFFQDVSELLPLMALCKNAKKLRDFPTWVRGYWDKSDPFGLFLGGEYIGTADDKEVMEWFRGLYKRVDAEDNSIIKIKRNF